MDRLHSNNQVWPAIKARVRSQSGQIIAAVAYVGIDAPGILPLRRGDLLVCNASKAAIKQGSTSALALETYFKRGVLIFSQPRLHGKVVCLSKRAFVGSANISSRSKNDLYEAVIETTSKKLVDSARRFVLDLSTEYHQLTKSEVGDLKKVKISKNRPPDSFDDPKIPLEIPKSIPRIYLMELIRSSWTNKMEKVAYAQKSEVRVLFHESAQIAGIEGIPFRNYAKPKLRQNDWAVGLFENGRISKPSQFLKYTMIDKDWCFAWFAIPKRGNSSIVDRNLLHVLEFDHNSKTDPSRWATSSETKRVLGLFRN